MIFKVGIDKVYFPEEIRPKDKFTTMQEVVKVRAQTRSEAAANAWKKYGARWQKQMREDVRQVSLYVSGANKGSNGFNPGGYMNRLDPVRVL